MNTEACANCLVHGWKQLENKTLLLQCQNCKLILYCGKECQLEHWNKVHRRHCEYFADPTKNEPWQHKEQDCVICQQAAAVEESTLMQAENPNYECIHKKIHELSPDLHHPHPFPVTGQPGNIREKAVIVLWQLVRKFQLIHPNVARVCQDEFLEVEDALVKERLGIWFNRKIYPQPLAQYSCFFLYTKLSSIDEKMETSDKVDPFKLWEIIMLVANIDYEVVSSNKSQFFKDPLANQPDDVQKLVSDGMNNTTEYLTVASDVLEALAIKVIPYQEVLKIICGGILEQKCSFCFKEVFISNEYFSTDDSHPSNVFFSPLLLGKYSCGGEDCTDQSNQMVFDDHRFSIVLADMRHERSENRCDFCFQLTPIKQVGSAMRDIHRCSYCRTTMYCSMECLHQDWKIHLKVCHKDGRKKKLGGSARREVAKKKLGGSARREVARKKLEEMEEETKEFEKEAEDV